MLAASSGEEGEPRPEITLYDIGRRPRSEIALHDIGHRPLRIPLVYPDGLGLENSRVHLRF